MTEHAQMVQDQRKKIRKALAKALAEEPTFKVEGEYINDEVRCAFCAASSYFISGRGDRIEVAPRRHGTFRRRAWRLMLGTPDGLKAALATIPKVIEAVKKGLATTEELRADARAVDAANGRARATFAAYGIDVEGLAADGPQVRIYGGRARVSFNASYDDPEQAARVYVALREALR